MPISNNKSTRSNLFSVSESIFTFYHRLQIPTCNETHTPTQRLTYTLIHITHTIKYCSKKESRVTDEQTTNYIHQQTDEQEDDDDELLKSFRTKINKK